MSRTVKAAVVQAGSFVFDTPRTLEKLADLAAQAQAEGAEDSTFHVPSHVSLARTLVEHWLREPEQE